MVVICARSPIDNERVDRLRSDCTNFPSASAAAGSATGGPIDRLRVSGFFSGASALRIWSSVTSSALAAPIESAAPIVKSERSAMKACFAEFRDMGSPPLGMHPRKASSESLRRSLKKRRVGGSALSVAFKFLDNIWVHRLRVIDVHVAIRSGAAALSGQTAPV